MTVLDLSHVPAGPGDTPATGDGAPAAPLPALASLSPSRAADFMACPLRYRFRVIDKLDEKPSPAASRGTLVHAALERLFDLPAGDRTAEAARDLLPGEWERLVADTPELDAMLDGEQEREAFLAGARELTDAYFTLEDPTRLEPAEREVMVSHQLPGGLLLRGIIDRLDVAPTGELRIVDYKGLALETPLPTPAGWTTMGEVQVGDQVLGADGRPCRVTVKSGVHSRPCYEVAFTDGSTVVCDNVHLWQVHVPEGDGYAVRVLDADALAALVHERPSTRRGRRRLFVEASAPVDLPAAELPVDPWLLGAWLGDGATRSGALTVGHEDGPDMLTLLKEHWHGQVKVAPWSTKATASALDMSCVSADPELCPYGHGTFRRVTRDGRTYRRCLQEREHAGGSRSNSTLTWQLRQLGVLRDKHVPAAYLRASSAQRLALLRGLMDTDGSWNELKHSAVFVTTNARLAAAVRELVHSLGGTSTVFAKPYVSARGPRVAHRVVFRPAGFNPFSLPRKAARVDAWAAARGARQGNGAVVRERRRTLASVTPVPSVPTQCIAVDAPDSLYLCGQDFVPTHNTGKAPREAYEAKALFQMKFYALVLWRTRGVVPRVLQLVYLGDRELLRYVPDEADLVATERKLLALWEAVERATQLRDFRPNPSRLCDWCDHQALCPSFGGTPPPWPTPAAGPGEADSGAGTPSPGGAPALLVQTEPVPAQDGPAPTGQDRGPEPEEQR